MRFLLTATLASVLTLAPLLASAAATPDTAMRVSDLAVRAIKQARVCGDTKKHDDCDCKKACKQDACTSDNVPQKGASGKPCDSH